MRRLALFVLILTLAAPGCGDDGGGGGGQGGVGSATPSDIAESLELQNRGLGHLTRYDYTKALETLEQAYALTPDWQAAKFHLALAYQHANDETRPKALAMMRQIAAADPNHSRAVFAAGILAENAGETDEAIEHYRRAYRNTEDPVIGAKLGGILLSSDLIDEAFEVLSQVHEDRPALIAPVNSLQLLHRRRGETARADELLALLRSLTGGVNDDAEWIKAGEEMTDAYGNLGRYSRADPRFGGAENEPDWLAVTATSAPLVAGGVVCGPPPDGAPPYPGLTVFDYDGDEDLDVFVCGGTGQTALLRNDGELRFTDVTDDAGLRFTGAYAVAAGELDVDPKVAANVSGRDTMIDLVIVFPDRVLVMRNAGNGTFMDVTQNAGLADDPGGARAVLLFDADHEGDMDLFLAGDATHGNRLYANRGPGTFVDVTEASGLAGDGESYGPVIVLDADQDHDLDLLITRAGRSPALYLNERLLSFRDASDWVEFAADGTHGGFAGDFDRDGIEDVFLAGESGAIQLRGTTRGFVREALFDAPGGAAVPLDAQLSGSADVLFSNGTYLHGLTWQFTGAGSLVPTKGARNLVAADLDGDGVEEVVTNEAGSTAQLVQLDCAGRFVGLSLDFRGVIRNDVQAGWSNLEGRHAWVEAKAGSLWQGTRVGGTTGYGAQAPTRTVFGLGARPSAEFVRILWTDAVQQGALDVPVGAPYLIVEEQRRPDSCPLLFSWDGHAYRWITDFIGAGGVGFLLAPGVYAEPDPRESVKVDGELVAPNDDGDLVFKLVEAMEEMVYLDHMDLQVVDSPPGVSVHPDERFTGERPFADGHVIAHGAEILPAAARDGSGRDVLAHIAVVDRIYSEEPGLHPRLTGAIDGSVLELDFADRLADVAPGDALGLFLHGWIEYGYTRTSVAAHGEEFEYVLPTLEAFVGGDDGGSWKTLAPNIGYPAGFPRVMTYDVTGLVSRDTPRLRIRTNLEIYWDRVWLARPLDTATTCRVTELTPERATLARVGYPREYTPDGRFPRIYDYHTRDESMPWKTVVGDYTKFGDVLPLLTAADDRYVIYGKAEEVDVRFAASALPALEDGWRRDYILRFTGWCKGQELYIAHGYTVEPLPFLGMSTYPYGADESYPDTPEHRAYRVRWNTRRVRGGEPEIRGSVMPR